jgi:hypothetical protein
VTRVPGTDLPELDRREEPLPFIPDRPVTPSELRRLLAEGTLEARAWAVSRLLLYAEWDEIWTFVTRDEVIGLFGELELPPALREKWARMLRIEESPAPTAAR